MAIVGLKEIRRLELESQMIEFAREGALRQACDLLKIASELLVVSGNMRVPQLPRVDTLLIQFKEAGFEVKMLVAEGNPLLKKRRCEERQA